MRPFFAPFTWLFLTVIARGQAEPAFTRLSVPGIEGAQVRAAVTDPYGALWLGTDRGVHRFDGSRTESFVNEPLDSLSLSDDSVYDLVLGPDGRIWVASFLGAWCIDPFDGARRRIPMKLPDGRIGPYECLGLDWGADGSLWAFCNRRGLARMEPDDDTLRVVWQPEAASVRGGWVAPNGTVWCSNRLALVAFDPRTAKAHEHPFLIEGRPAPPKTLLLDAVPDAHDPDALWCTSWGLGLSRFSIRQQRFDRQVLLHDRVNDLQNIVHHAVQIGPDHWWLTCDGELAEVMGPGTKVRRMAAVGISGHISALVQLGGGAVLLGGTELVGMAMPNLGSLDVVTAAFKGRSSFMAPASDAKGYWLVTYYANRRLFRLDGHGQVLDSLYLPLNQQPYEAFKVKQLTDGSVWLGTTQGLLKHRPGTNEVEPVPVERAGVPVPNPYVFGMHQDGKGTLWAGMASHGLLKWDIDANSGHCFLPPLGAGGERPYVLGVEGYDDEHMLVNLSQSGPALYRFDSGTFERLAGDRVPAEHFRSMTDLKVDEHGRVYVLTRSHGVLRLQRDSRGWFIGLRWLPPDRPVFESVTMDGRGRMWLVSNTGGYLIDPVTDIMHRLDPLHGFPLTTVSSFAEGHDGEVLVNYGVWYRTGENFEPLVHAPVLMLRGAMSGQQPIGIRTLLNDGAVLPYARNDLHLAFGVVALHQGDAFTYAYRITRDQETGEWSELKRQRSFSLLDLRPGAYALEIRAQSPFTQPVSLALRFNILPPWWGTWWTRLLIIAMAVLLVVVLTRWVLQRRFRIRLRELERERELEKVRMRIARDIHDGIGSGLTKITMLSRQMDASAAPQAARIAEASTELVNELGEIVWTVDPRNDSFASFLAYVRSVLGRQFEDLQVDLQSDLHCADTDRERTIGPELKRNILLVLKEAVSNALKHSGASQVAVRLRLESGRAELSVRDNGHGFDPQRIREGANGLANFSKRAEALGGNASVATGPDGTTVKFSVPIPPTKM
ncbi:MAG TPA: ATP-binding protein [Flavobacteriales bacterium]|nr:ATP-binding protein [Flavobacteriales bacterium]